ncbi:hypothetical protein LCGC14_0808280, partial [marine sediment metagenome]
MISTANLKFIKIKLLLVLLVIAIVVFSGIFTIKADAAAWSYYTDWSRRVPVAVDNSGNATALSNYQVRIEVNHVSGMKADFSDIRFTDEDGDTRLDYWLETKTDST